MVAVGGVSVAVVRVIDVAIVADGLVTAARPVGVDVIRMGQMRKRMLVVMVVMRSVRMTLMDVIDMPLAFDHGMSAVRPVLVLMGGMRFMASCHGSSLL